MDYNISESYVKVNLSDDSGNCLKWYIREEKTDVDGSYASFDGTYSGYNTKEVRDIQDVIDIIKSSIQTHIEMGYKVKVYEDRVVFDKEEEGRISHVELTVRKLINIFSLGITE